MLNTEKKNKIKNKEEKRPPGRPRLNPAPVKIPLNGIVDEPEDEDNIIEMKYNNLLNFKKISTYFKSLSADKVRLFFNKTGLKIYTENYLETNNIRITLQGNLMNSYYCGEEQNITILRTNLELIFGKLNKDYESMTFSIRKGNRVNNLYITLNSIHKIPEHFTIDLLVSDDKNTDYLFDNIDEEPTIEMKLTGNFFKKVIQDTKGGFKKEIEITKCGIDNNVHIESESENQQVKAVYPIPNDLIINSNVEEDEIFSVSLQVDDVKPTSINTLSNYIYFKLWVDKPAYLYATTSNGDIHFDIRINIIDCRILEE